MKHVWITATALLLTAATSVLAGENFQDSVSRGDEQRKYAAFERALGEFKAAHGQAANNTERAIASSKMAEVYAFDLRDYVNARTEAEKALALTDVHPVGQVIAYRALAECQIKQDKNPEAAALTLEKAMKLEGVEWARPMVLLALGDCYRMTSRPEQAIAAYEQVIGLTGDNQPMRAVTHLNIGLTYQYNLRNRDKARTAYDAAVALDPSLKPEVEKHLAATP